MPSPPKKQRSAHASATSQATRGSQPAGAAGTDALSRALASLSPRPGSSSRRVSRPSHWPKHVHSTAAAAAATGAAAAATRPSPSTVDGAPSPTPVSKPAQDAPTADVACEAPAAPPQADVGGDGAIAVAADAGRANKDGARAERGVKASSRAAVSSSANTLIAPGGVFAQVVAVVQRERGTRSVSVDSISGPRNSDKVTTTPASRTADPVVRRAPSKPATRVVPSPPRTVPKSGVPAPRAKVTPPSALDVAVAEVLGDSGNKKRVARTPPASRAVPTATAANGGSVGNAAVNALADGGARGGATPTDVRPTTAAKAVAASPSLVAQAVAEVYEKVGTPTVSRPSQRALRRGLGAPTVAARITQRTKPTLPTGAGAPVVTVPAPGASGGDTSLATPVTSSQVPTPSAPHKAGRLGLGLAARQPRTASSRVPRALLAAGTTAVRSAPALKLRQSATSTSPIAVAPAKPMAVADIIAATAAQATETTVVNVAPATPQAAPATPQAVPATPQAAPGKPATPQATPVETPATRAVRAAPTEPCSTPVPAAAPGGIDASEPSAPPSPSLGRPADDAHGSLAPEVSPVQQHAPTPVQRAPAPKRKRTTRRSTRRQNPAGEPAAPVDASADAGAQPTHPARRERPRRAARDNKMYAMRDAFLGTFPSRSTQSPDGGWWSAPKGGPSAAKRPRRV